MKKEWYIFVNSSHVGPYSQLEMKAFYDKKDIKDSTLIWREGMEEWLPYKKVDLFGGDSVNEDDLPPPLPEDVFVKLTKATEAPSMPSILRPKPEPVLEEKIETSYREFRPPSSFNKNNKIILKVLGVLGFLVIIIGAFIIYQNSRTPDLHIKGVSPVNREQLENQLSVDNRNLSFAFALSMDKGNLWVATNQSDNLSVTIDLKSIAGRLLGDDKGEEIHVRLQGMVNNHIGHFTSMRIMKGTNFLPGEYNVHIKGKKIHWINQYFKLDYISLNQEFTYEFKSLIYSGNAKEFERKILERQLEKIGKVIKPWQDKMESFITLRSLLEKTMEHFIFNVEKCKDGKSFSGFEKDYTTNVSPILQALVFSTNTDLDKEPDFKTYNTAIVDIGKKMGVLASEIITHTTRLKKIDYKMKTNLREKFQKKSDDIYSLIKNNITQIDSKIKAIQAPVK